MVFPNQSRSYPSQPSYPEQASDDGIVDAEIVTHRIGSTNPRYNHNAPALVTLDAAIAPERNAVAAPVNGAVRAVQPSTAGIRHAATRHRVAIA